MTALELHKCNCNIVFACRDKKKTLEIIEWIRSEYEGTNRLEFVHLELSDLRSVERFPSELQKLGVDRID